MRTYEKPELEIINFESVDVLKSSSEIDDGKWDFFKLEGENII